MSLHKVFAHSRALLARNASINKLAREQAVRNTHVIATPATEKVSFKVKKDEKRGKKGQLISDKENIPKEKENQPVKPKISKKSGVEQKKVILKKTENLENSFKNIYDKYSCFKDSNTKETIKNTKVECKPLLNVTHNYLSNVETSETLKTQGESENSEFKNNLKSKRTSYRTYKTSNVQKKYKKKCFKNKKVKKVISAKKKRKKVLKKKTRSNVVKNSLVKKNFIQKKVSVKPIDSDNIVREFSLTKNKVLKVCFWNVAGLKKKGKKFWNFVKEMDVVGFLETWVTKRRWSTLKKRLPQEYNWMCSFALKRKHKGRPKGGVLFGVRNEITTKNENCITTRGIIESEIILGNKKIKILTIYNANSLNDDEDECLWNVLDNEVNPNDFLMIGGDFNARTGTRGGIVLNGVKQERISKDKRINKSGRKLLELCEKKKWIILNGNMENGLGKSTFFRETVHSVIDYVIVNTKMLPFIENFNVVTRKESDHMPLKVELNLEKLLSEEKEVLPQLKKETNINVSNKKAL